MQDESFINLRLQIEHILLNHTKLRQENQSLRKRIAKLTQERASLQNTKETTCKKIRLILTQINKEAA